MYRDRHEASRHRCARLIEIIVEREELVSDALVERLPEEMRLRLEASRRAVAAARHGVGDELEVVLSCEHALDGHLVLLDEIHARVPQIESAINALPDDVSPDHAAKARGLVRWTPPPPDWERARRLFPKLLAEIDPEARRLDEVRPYVMDFALRWGRMPLCLRVQPDTSHRDDGGEIELAMATRLRMSTPPLEVRPLTFIHAFTTALGVHRDRRLGDDAFDDRFLVLGDEGHARRMLPPSVQAALLRIATFDLPQLVIGDGVARIWWRTDITMDPLRAAVEILAHVRTLDTSIALMR
jgi:hypothetical protein